jgi:hypothetical protein
VDGKKLVSAFPRLGRPAGRLAPEASGRLRRPCRHAALVEPGQPFTPVPSAPVPLVEPIRTQTSSMKRTKGERGSLSPSSTGRSTATAHTASTTATDDGRRRGWNRYLSGFGLELHPFVAQLVAVLPVNILPRAGARRWKWLRESGNRPGLPRRRMRTGRRAGCRSGPRAFAGCGRARS